VRSDAHGRAERGGAGRHLPAGTRARGLAHPVPQRLPQRWRHPLCSCCAVDQCSGPVRAVARPPQSGWYHSLGRRRGAQARRGAAPLTVEGCRGCAAAALTHAAASLQRL
jgi:hypothetical protein